MRTKITVKSCSMLGALIALELICARFLSIHTANLKIGFTFVPIVVAAILYGPLAGALVAAFGDIINAILFPVGLYMPGITLTAVFTAVVFGVCLKNKQTVFRTVIAVLVGQFIGSLVFNTFWLSRLYQTPFMALFATRIYQAVGMSVVQIVTIVAMNKTLIPALKKVK